MISPCRIASSLDFGVVVRKLDGNVTVKACMRRLRLVPGYKVERAFRKATELGIRHFLALAGCSRVGKVEKWIRLLRAIKPFLLQSNARQPLELVKTPLDKA